MEVRYIASATVVVEHAGTRVLCDPWLTDGIYYGSWFQYPRPVVTPEALADVDWVYVSHIHPDHLDPETFRRLPRSLPVLVHEFEERFLRRMLERLGFEHVVELPNGARHELAPGFEIQVRAADNCDPAACGASFACAPPAPSGRTRQIDSLAVFSGGGRTLVNVNDCPYALGRHACDAVLAEHGTVDLLLAGYSGASAYPQCFDYEPEEMRRRALAKRDRCLAMALQYVEHLRPTDFMPFAGQYTLGGRHAALNPLRGVPELEELPELLGPRLPDTGLVLLDSGERFDLDSRTASAPFTGPDPAARERYVREQLAGRPYAYDAADAGAAPRDLTGDLRAAHARMRRHQQDWGDPPSAWTVLLDTGADGVYHVPFDAREPWLADAGDAGPEPQLRVGLPHELLRRILHREAHFNTAEIGSHLRFSRRPDVYERRLHQLLSYLQV
jgi:UDP-MurNAc hydroxylase